MLEIEGLVVRFDGRAVVDGVDLRVGVGEVVCVLGPSGGGKSTLLRAAAGLTPLDEGTIRWDGADLRNVPPHRRGFGLMFQDHALFPHRSVAGNVAFGLEMQGRRAEEVRDRTRAMLALVGLAGFDNRPVRALSGGEQQRVALARALAPDPRLLMLDEPLGALDRALRERLVAELRSVFAPRERSILVVTHDHEEAFALADRVVVMRAGRVEQDDAATTVWQRPATPFVARFLGYNVTRAFGALVAVRPDELRIDPAGTVAATVVDRTFRRDHFRIEARTDDGEVLDVAVHLADIPEPGTRVCLSLDPGAAVPLAEPGAPEPASA